MQSVEIRLLPTNFKSVQFSTIHFENCRKNYQFRTEGTDLKSDFFSFRHHEINRIISDLRPIHILIFMEIFSYKMSEMRPRWFAKACDFTRTSRHILQHHFHLKMYYHFRHITNKRPYIPFRIASSTTRDINAVTLSPRAAA